MESVRTELGTVAISHAATSPGHSGVVQRTSGGAENLKMFVTNLLCAFAYRHLQILNTWGKFGSDFTTRRYEGSRHEILPSGSA